MATTRSIARGTSTIDTHEAAAYDERAGGPDLSETRAAGRYLGDLEGTCSARFQVVRLKDGSRSSCGIERVDGRLGGRSGSFVLQQNLTREGSTWRGRSWVVRGSATGELAGLRGEGGFEFVEGHGEPEWTLEYWFEAPSIGLN